MPLAWIEVDGYENLPIGRWVVRHEGTDSRHERYCIAEKHERMCFSGGHFAYDLTKITHYAAFNEVPA
jgi:hypothetical protein